LTILPPSPLSEATNASNEPCGCGCGCMVSLTQLTLPPDAIPRSGDTARTSVK
jgi:hypothetical protein